MTEEGLAKISEELRRIAALHDCVFVDESRPRATSEQIEALESFVGAPLPSSYRSLLEWRDGLALRFIRKCDVEDAFPIASYQLTVYGTAEFARETENLQYIVETTSEIANDRVQRSFDIVNLGETKSRILFSLDAPRQPAEYGIFAIDIDDYNEQEWENAMKDVDRFVIADSLDDFLIKALDHMVKTENGFWYWHGPQRSLW